MMANAIDMSPPPPSPWMPRKMMSSVRFCDAPHRIEPRRKIAIADWNTILRP